MKKEKSRVLAWVLGGAVFFICLIAFRLSFWLSLLAGGGMYIAGRFLFPAKGKGKEMVSPGITQAELDDILTQGAAKVRSIRNSGRLLSKYEIRQQVEEIAKTADAIFEDFKRDPKDVKAARRFLNYYLDATERVVRRYYELSRGYGHTPETEEILARVEKALPLIHDTYQKILKKVMEDDFLDLDIELEVLEKTIKMEGV